MEERDRTLGAAARRGVDQLEAVDLEAEQRLGQVRRPRSRRDGSPRPSTSRKRATPVVSSVGSTSSIFDSPDPEERDPDPVVGDVHDGLELERRACRARGRARLDRTDDERDVVDLAEPVAGRSGRREAGGVDGTTAPAYAARRWPRPSPRARSSSGSRCHAALERVRRAVGLGGRRRRAGPRHDPLPVPAGVGALTPGGPRRRSPRSRAAHEPVRRPVPPASGASRGVVYLVPEPSAPFTTLTAAVVARYPRLPAVRRGLRRRSSRT